MTENKKGLKYECIAKENSKVFHTHFTNYEELNKERFNTIKRFHKYARENKYNIIEENCIQKYVEPFAHQGWYERITLYI